MKASPAKTWGINMYRIAVIALGIVLCILLGDKLDRFNSLIGTVAATPIAFTVPCIMHYKMCNP